MITLAFLLALSATNARVARDRPSPVIHYRCEVVRQTTAGVVHVTRTVDGSGHLLDVSAIWRALGSEMPVLSGGWVVRSGRELDLAHGYLTLDIGDAADLDHILKGSFSFELSTTTAQDHLGSTIMGRASRLSNLRNSFPDLIVDWADAVALSKGATALFLNARDKRGRLLRSWELKREVFAGVEVEIAAAQRAVLAMAAHPVTECQSFDPNDDSIVVT